MARIIQGIIAKNKLMKEPMVVVNKGAEQARRISRRKEAKAIRTSSSSPCRTCSRPACDQYAVQLARPDAGADDGPGQFRSLGQRRDALQDNQGIHRRGQGGGGKFKMGGTGSKQEDQIITVAIEKQTGAKFIYISYRGGGEVAVQLVASTSIRRSTTRSKRWRSGAPVAAAPLRVRLQAHALQDEDHQRPCPVHIQTCKDTGLDVEYLMLRGIFMPGG